MWVDFLPLRVRNILHLPFNLNHCCRGGFYIIKYVAPCHHGCSPLRSDQANDGEDNGIDPHRTLLIECKPKSMTIEGGEFDNTCIFMP